MATYQEFQRVFAPLIEIKEVRMEGQEKQFYDIEVVIKGIDHKPMSPTPGKPQSFRWIVYTEEQGIYSTFAPTSDQNSTILRGLQATHIAKLRYYLSYGVNKQTNQTITYYNITEANRILPADHQEPAMNDPVTAQEQQTIAMPQTAPAPQATTAVPIPVQANADEPEFINEATAEEEIEADSGLEELEIPQRTMMVNPIARSNIAAAIMNIYQANGLYVKSNKTLEAKIMKRISGIVEAMDSLE